MSKIKTVVEIDLVGYSDIVRPLEDNLGVEVVAKLNQKIQEFIDIGLTKVNTNREKVVKATNGDNALVVFESPIDAHYFAKAVHEHTKKHNDLRKTPSAERWFRIGCATGELSEIREKGKEEIAGVVIADAYRLEAAAKPGEILIDTTTYAKLPAELQKEYGSEEEVSGKRNERLRAHRCRVIPTHEEKSTKINPIEILELFDKLKPRDQLIRLMVLIEMPKNHRPSDSLSIFDRQDKIIDWMLEQENGLRILADKLHYLIEKQTP